MKFTIELEDFWMEEEGTIEEQLKEHITHSVISEIRTKLKDQIDTTITKVVKEQFENSLESEIAMITRAVIESETVKTGSGKDSPRIAIKDWIIQKIESKDSWNNPQKELQKFAAKYMDEIKAQYDFIYASSVVQKMGELGMLKDDKMAEILNKLDKK